MRLFTLLLLLSLTSCFNPKPQEYLTEFEDEQAGLVVVETLLVDQDSSFKQRTATDMTTGDIAYQTNELFYFGSDQDSLSVKTTCAWKIAQKDSFYRYSLTLEQYKNHIPSQILRQHLHPTATTGLLQINLDATTALSKTRAQQHLENIAHAIVQAYQQTSIPLPYEQWSINEQEQGARIKGRFNVAPHQTLQYDFVQTVQHQKHQQSTFWSNRRQDYPTQTPTYWITPTDTLQVDWQAQFETHTPHWNTMLGIIKK